LEFLDVRNTLSRHPTKTFAKRTRSEIQGGCVHHTGGGDDPYSTARYHVGPNHISDTGCPALCYAFYIDKRGIIYWANDLEEITWSQGSHSANRNYLAIVCGGDFSKDSPPFDQILSLLVFWGHLTGAIMDYRLPRELYAAIKCPPEALYGHHNFGKPECPGIVYQTLVNSIREHLHRLVTIEDWQQKLNDAGASPLLIVDGVWGPKSEAALKIFQTLNDLVPDGIRGPLSEAQLLQF